MRPSEFHSRAARIAWQIGGLLPVAVIPALFACADDPVAPRRPSDLRTSVAATDTVAGAVDDTPDSTKYWIVLKPGSGRAVDLANSVLPGVRGKLRWTFETPQASFTVGGLSDSAVAWISRLPQVERIERLQRFWPDTVQSLPADNSKYHLDQIDQQGGTLDNQFNYFFAGTGVHVYIVDTGVRGDHSEFAGRVGNGVGFFGPINPDPYVDDCGHGTGVASMALGATVGVAKGATLHSVRITVACGALEDDFRRAIDWVVANGARPAVINVSFRLFGTTARDALARAVSADVPVVKSAGNENKDACSDATNTVQSILVVGATNQSYARYAQSNYGLCVKIWAPGQSLRVAKNDGTYDTLSGTSVSAPIVTGVAATLIPQLLAKEGILSAARVYNIIRGSATAAPEVPLSNLGAGAQPLFVNSLHRYFTLDSHGCPGDLYPEDGGWVQCNYDVLLAYGGDGTWSNYRWLRSQSGGPFSLVSTAATYSATYFSGDYFVDYRISSDSFGRTLTLRYRVNIRPNRSCRPGMIC